MNIEYLDLITIKPYLANIWIVLEQSKMTSTRWYVMSRVPRIYKIYKHVIALMTTTVHSWFKLLPLTRSLMNRSSWTLSLGLCNIKFLEIWWNSQRVNSLRKIITIGIWWTMTKIKNDGKNEKRNFFRQFPHDVVWHTHETKLNRRREKIEVYVSEKGKLENRKLRATPIVVRRW